MTVKVELDSETLARVDACAPLAPRAAILRRLVALGLECVEGGAELCPRGAPVAGLPAGARTRSA